MTLRELLNHYHETDIYVQKVRLQENLEYQNLLKFLTDHCDLSGTKVTEIESDDHYGIFVEDNVIFLNNKYYLKLAENFLNIKFVLSYLKTEYFSNTKFTLYELYDKNKILKGFKAEFNYFGNIVFFKVFQDPSNSEKFIFCSEKILKTNDLFGKPDINIQFQKFVDFLEDTCSKFLEFNKVSHVDINDFKNVYFKDVLIKYDLKKIED